ncbi:hypothetical protein PRZ48_006814 [Zasmidium cellare]|uniref:HSF-type DNA-binding domain-containing protein n=1 Tax=Zasmidium cellare TaxID=395010 RepID=A0ABR0EIY4_ZASCE|nr:hypothetical protein PRZ48_006814 [Zasmidium cellare]
MQQSVPSRKRPAPGASPPMQQAMNPQPQYQYQQMPDNPDFSNFDFSNNLIDQTFPDSSLADANNFAAAFNTQQTQPQPQPQPQTYGSNIAPAPSTDLVRRARNQQLAPQPGYQEQWNGGMGNSTNPEDDDIEELKRRAEIAKNEARGKRKQIPPFVQKLSSFLDHANTDLIRWSDDGKSFIVLDEDEFARKLIPELFKHNNYASFVRQLNMYGFHKTVNITDGSLRQSEKARKGVKPPSMYSHPYFRRGQPDLLWLIQKPSSKSNAKRKRDGNIKDGFDSDDERQFSPGPDGRPHELGLAGGHGGDVAQMPRGELASVKQELKKLQQQQGIISRMIGQLKEQNDQFYRQATAFQALHDRHENSINAILTFLATFYNRSLDGHSGQNLVNMFNNQGGQSSQQQTGVVEEYNDNGSEANQQVQTFVKRPQLLLTDSVAKAGHASTQPNSARASASPPEDASTPNPTRDSTSSVPPQPPASATVGRNTATASPGVKTDAQTPDVLHQVPENDQMLSLINNVNATTAPSDNPAPAYDFSAALNHYQNANGNAPLTANQRDDMLQMIASHQGADASNNSALTMPNMPGTGFNLDEFNRRNKEIENLQDFQKRHDDAIKGVEKRLGQFSPSGSISGASGMYNGGSGFDGNFTIPDDLNFQDYLNDDTDLRYADDNPEMFSYNLDGTGADGTGQDMFGTADNGTANAYLAPDTAAGTVESLSSEATSPAATAQLDGEVDGVEQEPGTPNKRQRRS